MIDRIQGAGGIKPGPRQQQNVKKPGGSFGELFQQVSAQKEASINFSKHAMSRAEERGIELTPALMEQLADTVEKAQEKGAKNILALNATQAFIINVPYGRVITTMNQDDMKENIFTNIDGAVLI